MNKRLESDRTTVYSDDIDSNNNRDSISSHNHNVVAMIIKMTIIVVIVALFYLTDLKLTLFFIYLFSLLSLKLILVSIYLNHQQHYLLTPIQAPKRYTDAIHFWLFHSNSWCRLMKKAFLSNLNCKFYLYLLSFEQSCTEEELLDETLFNTPFLFCRKKENLEKGVERSEGE